MSDKSSQITGKRKEITEDNLLYSLFNPYLFHEAKVNIYLYERLMIRRNHPEKSKVRTLVRLIRENEYKDITSHLIENTFELSTPEEKNCIWEDIERFKQISKADIQGYRDRYRETCLNELILSSNEFSSAEDKINYLKEHEYKDSFSTQIRVMSFDEAADSGDDVLVSSGIKAPLKFIDNTSPLNQYLNGQLVCFTGDTKVMTDKGHIRFDELTRRFNEGEKFKALTWDFESDEFVESNIINSFITGEEVNLIKLEFNDGSRIECTLNHRFLLESGEWKEAKDLTLKDGIRSYYGTLSVVDSEIRMYYVPTKVYDLTVDHKDHNFLLMNGGVCHNCISSPPGNGKSLWMMHQAAIAANSGKRVFTLAAGDLRPSDFLTRIASMVTEIPLSEVYLDLHENMEKAKHYLKGNLDISCVPSQKVTAKEYVNYCLDRIDDYDVFMLDYDANLATDSESMYEAGGVLYDLLTEITSYNKLVFVASQPKIHTWSQEVLGLDSLNESSRKQHILDVVITLSRAKGANHVGIMNIAKNRRGDLASSPVILSSCGKFVELRQEKYQQLNNNPNKLTKNELLYRNLVAESGTLDGYLESLAPSPIINP